MTEQEGAAPALSRFETSQGLRISTVEGLYATVWSVLTTGAFQIGFARYLGANDFMLGLLAGLPAAVGLIQIFASLYSDRLPSRKGFVAVYAIVGRLCWLPILAIPFVVPESLRQTAFIVLLTLSSALLTVTTPAWTAWMSDLVPPEIRGRYFGQRNMICGIATMLVPLPAGAFLDLAVKYHRFDPRIGFAALFAVSCLAALGSLAMILRQPEPPRVASPEITRVNPFTELSAPLSDTNFRNFIIYSSAIVISQGLCGQFFTAWQLDHHALNLPYFTVQVLGAVASGAGLATNTIWGYLSDKFGSRPLLHLATAATVIAPIIWVFTVPGMFWLNITLIVILNILSGISWAGVGLAQFNLLLAAAPSESRSTYVAVFSAITGVVGGIAPIAGGIAMELMHTMHVPVGPIILNNFRVLFIATALIRVACTFMLRGVHEQDGRSTRYVIDQLKASHPVSSYLRLRRLTRPANAAQREQAILQLAELRSPLAVEELVRALDDVSATVRESAARALGEIRDARAAPALAAKLLDPAAGIGELAAEALGHIGDRSVTPMLNIAVRGEDARVRIAALKALAQIGDPLALDTIIGALDRRYPATCEAACAAAAASAGELTQASAIILVRDNLLPLLSPDAPRGVRSSAARALRSFAALAGTATIEFELTLRLTSEPDPAVAAHIAYALAAFPEELTEKTHDLSKPEPRTSALLATLDRDDMDGIAYKLTLAAVSETGLAVDAFYPFLGLDEMERDEMAEKLSSKLKRTLDRTGAADEKHLVADALAAYTEWRYTDAVRMIGQLSALRVQPGGLAARRAAATLRAMTYRVNDTTGHPEEFLLALSLARVALIMTH